MSILRTVLRLAVTTLVLVAFVPGTTATAQSDSRPIYPFTGSVDDAIYNWGENPDSMTVWIFREPVSPEDPRGRVIRSPDQESLRSDSSELVEKTRLERAAHPEYVSRALRTRDNYPSRQDGTEQRYLLVIETSDGIHFSRTLDGRNYPRYHTLDSPAHVRVSEGNSQWEKEVEELLQRAQNGPAQQADPASPKNTSPEDPATSTRKAASGVARSSTSGSGLIPPWIWKVLIGLLVAGILLFLLVRYFTPKKKKRSRSRKKKFGKSGSRSSKVRSETSSEKSVKKSESKPEQKETSKLDKIIEKKVESFLEEKSLARSNETSDNERPLAKVNSEKIRKLDKNFGEIKKDVESLREDLYITLDQLRDQNSQTEDSSEPPSSEEKNQKETSKKIAETFVEWCKTAGGRVRKFDRFQDHLNDKMRRADARTIQYERDSVSDEFLEDARNGVTYWLVDADGERFALPHPTNRNRFGNLQPVYRGDASPKNLEGIEPARLTSEAGRLVLDESGRVW